MIVTLHMVSEGSMPMSSKTKLHDRIMSDITPADVTYAELHSFLVQKGFVKSPENGSSHKIYKNPLHNRHINVPAHDDGSIIKKSYIKKIKEVIEDIENKEN